MTYKTHLIGGAQAGILMSYMLLSKAGDIESCAPECALAIGTALIGSVLPDIDHPQSKLSQSDILFGAVSKTTSKVTPHRGFTHTLPGAFLFALLFFAMAIYRTGQDSVFAVYASLTIFALMLISRSVLSSFAGITAAAVYIFGPNILNYITSHDIQMLDLPENHTSAEIVFAGIFAGCLMHMLYDSFTKGGIMWLYPISKKKFSFARLKTNTSGEIRFRILQVLILITMTILCGHSLGIWNLRFDYANFI